MELKNVIHYYLGCRVQVATKDAPKEIFNGEMVEVSNHHSNHGRWIIVNHFDLVEVYRNGDKHASNMHHYFIGEDSIKPLLRKLEDMDSEEKIIYHGKLGHASDGVHATVIAVETPASFHYLLSRGYDLFGLIASGQAIDQSSLNPQVNK